MKRFAVFVCECYYPGGGWNDFHASYDTLEEAQSVAKNERAPYTDTHVADLVTGEICQ